jgi:hypothetical protein
LRIIGLAVLPVSDDWFFRFPVAICEFNSARTRFVPWAAFGRLFRIEIPVKA